MSDGLVDRLNQILPKVTSDTFLSGKGIGNEIAFYIFDYPPEDELRVRNHIQFLLDHIPRQKPNLRVSHVNLLDFVLDHLRKRKLLDKAIEMQKTKGDAFVQRQLATILHPNRIAPAFAEIAQPDQHDLVLVSGVGSVYPMLRANSLLNNFSTGQILTHFKMDICERLSHRMHHSTAMTT